jgi:hypothetical protein
MVSTAVSVDDTEKEPGSGGGGVSKGLGTEINSEGILGRELGICISCSFASFTQDTLFDPLVRE